MKAYIPCNIIGAADIERHCYLYNRDLSRYSRKDKIHPMSRVGTP